MQWRNGKRVKNESINQESTDTLVYDSSTKINIKKLNEQLVPLLRRKVAPRVREQRYHQECFGDVRWEGTFTYLHQSFIKVAMEKIFCYWWNLSTVKVKLLGRWILSWYCSPVGANFLKNTLALYLHAVPFKLQTPPGVSSKLEKETKYALSSLFCQVFDSINWFIVLLFKERKKNWEITR